MLAEEGVEGGLIRVVVRKIDGLDLAVARLLEDLELGVVVPNPLDAHVRVLIDAAGLLEELLDLWQRVEPSRRARGDDARPLRVGGEDKKEEGGGDEASHHGAAIKW